MTNVLAAGRVRAGDRGAARRSLADVRAYKISKRFDCDISAVCAGLAIELDDATRSSPRVSRSAAWQRRSGARRAPRPRSSARAGTKPRSRSAAGCADERLRAAHRHARQRRLPHAGRAEPAAPLLARDASRSRRSPRTRRASGAALPHSSARRDRGAAVNRALDPRWLRRAPTAAATATPTRRARRRRAAARVGAPARRRRRAVRRRPARARRHAARGARPVAGRARPAASPSIARASRRCPASSPCSSPPTSRARNDCGPVVHDDPILADGVVHYLGQPVFAVIAETRDVARRAAAEAKAALTIEPLAPILTPVEAHAAKSYVLPPMHLAPRRRARRDRRRAAPPRRHARRRRPGAVLSRGPDLVRGAARGPRHARPLLDAASERDAAPGRELPRPAVAPRAGRVPAHGRRLRRQGVAVGAVRLRRRDRGEAARPPGQAPPRPRRRLPGHRPAPLLPLRVRGRLRRRRPHPRRRADDGLARRLLGRSLGAGDDARDLPLRQRVLAARRRDPRLLGAHQHAEQHRVSRLRRPAGRDRGREHPRHGRAARSARTRSTSAASTSTGRARGPARPASATSRRTARSSTTTSSHELVDELETTSGYRARRARDRRVQCDEPGAEARHRADAGQVRHLVQPRPPQPGGRARPRLRRRLGARQPRRHRDGPGAATPRSRRSSRTSSASTSARFASPRPTRRRSPTRRRRRRRPAAI